MAIAVLEILYVITRRITLIYLDNSATTRPFDSVIDVMDACMRDTWFNP